METVIWIVFLLGAPALLYWMWNSNRQRREQWRTWCRTHAWRIDIDLEGKPGEEHAPGLPDFPIDQSHRRRQSVNLLARGPYQAQQAATWEWNTAWRNMPARGRGASISNKLHAVALQLPSQAGTRLCLLPPAMALLSMSGMLSWPVVDPGIVGTLGRWTLHAQQAELAQAWLRAHGGDTGPLREAPADLAVVQVEGDWLVAWHLGETRLDRIESTLAWLSRITAHAAAPR